MTQLNGHTSSTPLIALLTYSVSGIDCMLLPDGSLLIDGAHLDQQQAWVLSACLTLPGRDARYAQPDRTHAAGSDRATVGRGVGTVTWAR